MSHIKHDIRGKSHLALSDQFETVQNQARFEALAGEMEASRQTTALPLNERFANKNIQNQQSQAQIYWTDSVHMHTTPQYHIFILPDLPPIVEEEDETIKESQFSPY